MQFSIQIWTGEAQAACLARIAAQQNGDKNKLKWWNKFYFFPQFARVSRVPNSLSPGEGHFVVETRLAMIHVCTSNENAYQERRVSYLGGVFDGLK